MSNIPHYLTSVERQAQYDGIALGIVDGFVMPGIVLA